MVPSFGQTPLKIMIFMTRLQKGKHIHVANLPVVFPWSEICEHKCQFKLLWLDHIGIVPFQDWWTLCWTEGIGWRIWLMWESSSPVQISQFHWKCLWRRLRVQHLRCQESLSLGLFCYHTVRCLHSPNNWCIESSLGNLGWWENLFLEPNTSIQLRWTKHSVRF